MGPLEAVRWPEVALVEMVERVLIPLTVSVARAQSVFISYGRIAHRLLSIKGSAQVSVWMLYETPRHRDLEALTALGLGILGD